MKLDLAEELFGEDKMMLWRNGLGNLIQDGKIIGDEGEGSSYEYSYEQYKEIKDTIQRLDEIFPLAEEQLEQEKIFLEYVKAKVKKSKVRMEFEKIPEKEEKIKEYTSDVRVINSKYNSLGVTIPKEVVNTIDLKKEDTFLFKVESISDDKVKIDIDIVKQKED